MSNIENMITGQDFINMANIFPFNRRFLFKVSEINSIDELFDGENYFAVILLGDQYESGHWVVIRKDSQNSFSYFDCLGAEIDPKIANLFNEMSYDCEVKILNKALMNESNIICGKYCILFCLSGDCDINDFYESLSNNKNMTSDQIVDNLVRIAIKNNDESPFY